MQAIGDNAAGLCCCQVPFDLIGKFWIAIDRHTQPIVIFAVIRIRDEFVQIAVGVKSLTQKGVALERLA